MVVLRARRHCQSPTAMFGNRNPALERRETATSALPPKYSARERSLREGLLQRLPDAGFAQTPEAQPVRFQPRLPASSPTIRGCGRLFVRSRPPPRARCRSSSAARPVPARNSLLATPMPPVDGQRRLRSRQLRRPSREPDRGRALRLCRRRLHRRAARRRHRARQGGRRRHAVPRRDRRHAGRPAGGASAPARRLDRAPFGGASAKVDVFLVSATNATLDKAIAEGRFRSDLLYRLNTLEVTLPRLA